MSSYCRQTNTSEPVVAEEEGFDGLLSSLGFGKWQLIILLSPFFAMSILPVHELGASFLNAPVPFHCSTGQTDPCDGYGENCTNNSTDNYLSRNETYFNSKCLSSPVNLKKLQLIANLRLGETQRRTSLDSCPIIEYDTSVYTSTVVSEWNLVCERSYLRPLFVTLCSIGSMFGSISGGYIGDRWGRLWAVKMGSIVNVLIIAAMISVPHYSLFLVTRFIAGWAMSATLVPAWSLGIENTASSHRTLVGMFLGLPFSVFLIGIAGMAYLIRTWQYLLLAGASSTLLLLPCAFIGTESPRWLLQKGRLEEAKKILQKAEKLNGAKLDAPISTYVDKLALSLKIEEISAAPENPTSKISVVEAVKKGFSYLSSPAMRTIILCMGVIWILHNFLYVGVAINTNNFASEDRGFLYVALTGVMDASAILLTTPLTSYFGRRVFLFAGFMVGGILFLLELLLVHLDTDLDWIRWVMIMAAFFLVAGALQVNFLYAPEVFPTEIRARGFAFVKVLGNVGSAIAPFITDVLSQYNWWVTGVTFACAGILGGLLVPLLPETRNKSLPETVQDVEDARKKTKDKKRQIQDIEDGRIRPKTIKQQLQGVENKSYIEDVSSHV